MLLLGSSRVICNGDGVSGAHNDIVHPELAHAFWETIMTEKGAGEEASFTSEEQSEPHALVTTTSLAPDVDQAAGRKVIARTQVTEGRVDTVLAADHADNKELIALHRTLTEKALDGWKK
ncbi:MAG: hypothetical protein D3925_06695 [Candidatus Electrothrix sp. AR5]|nr:hypothetical protein [Candidatus Electrothrix sp. AR5]